MRFHYGTKLGAWGTIQKYLLEQVEGLRLAL
jgi:hypothetical protein